MQATLVLLLQLAGAAAYSSLPVSVEMMEKSGVRLAAANNGTTAVSMTVSPCPDNNLPAPVPDKVPGDVIPQLEGPSGLGHWKLQLPCESVTTGTDGVSVCDGDYTQLYNKESESCCLTTPGIAEVKNYVDTFVLMPKQYKNDSGTVFCSGGMYVAHDATGDDMVVLHVPIAGTTTSGSKNPRIELRQMDGSKNAGFSLVNDDGVRTLTTTQRIMHLPSTWLSTSFVQIFNAGWSDDPPNSFKGGGPFIEVITQKCQYGHQFLPDGSSCTRGSAVIGVWRDGKFGSDGGFLFGEYTLGTKFDLEVTIPGDGSITFKYKHSEQSEWGEWRLDCASATDDHGPIIRGPPHGKGRNEAGLNRPDSDTGVQAASLDCLYYGDYNYPMSNGVHWKVGSYIQKAPQEVEKGNVADYALSYVYAATISGP